jgi:hypothetical protein
MDKQQELDSSDDNLEESEPAWEISSDRIGSQEVA